MALNHLTCKNLEVLVKADTLKIVNGLKGFEVSFEL